MASASATSVAATVGATGRPDVAGTPAQPGRDLGRDDGRIGGICESPLEVRADGSQERQPPLRGTMSRTAYRLLRLLAVPLGTSP